MVEAGLRLHGVTKSEADVTKLHELFLPYYEANIAVFSRPFEGASDVVDMLRQAGARVAVCTNKLEALSKSLLRQLQLEDRLAAVAGRDTFAVCKPDPGHLTGTIALAGGRPRRAVMVGDSEVDVATAIAAAVPCIGVSFGYTPRPMRELGASVVIDHYREFLPALDSILGRP
jgi:phosphoglycolate phosphatase